MRDRRVLEKWPDCFQSMAAETGKGILLNRSLLERTAECVFDSVYRQYKIGLYLGVVCCGVGTGYVARVRKLVLVY